MKLMLLCLLMAVVTAKAEPQVDLQQIEILETTVKEFKKTIRNADASRKKRILLKVIDSEQELVTFYSRKSASEPANGPAEQKANIHNKSLIETCQQFRKLYSNSEESDVVGLFEGKAYERNNDLSNAESIYREVIGPGAPDKIATQNKLSATIALTELLQQKQRYGEIKTILENHQADPSYQQYGTYLRQLAEAQANLKELESAYQTIQKEILHIKNGNFQSELPESIDTYAVVMTQVINQNDAQAAELINNTLPNLTSESESSYLKRMILNLSINDQKKQTLTIYEKFKSRIKTSDRIQLIDVIISQLNFGSDETKVAFQSAQSLLQELLNAKPEEVAAISTNKMNSLREALGKVEKASLNLYKTTKDTAPLIYAYSAQLKIETKSESLRGKILSNLYELYLERKDTVRARNTVKLLAQIKGNEKAVLHHMLELDQVEWDLQYPEGKAKLELKIPGSIPFDPKSPKTAHLKKWRDSLVAAKKIGSIDPKFLQFSTYELFKACYLTGILKTADELANLLLIEFTDSEASIKTITLMLETYRLGKDRKSQNRLADQILAVKSPEELTKLAKQIKYENFLIQQEDLMKKGAHEEAAKKSGELTKYADKDKNDLVLQSCFLAGVSFLELKREDEAIRQFESIMKTGSETMKAKAEKMLTIARFRLADKSNNLDATVASGLNLIQLAQKPNEQDDAMMAISKDQGFAKKILFYSWMSSNTAKAQETRELLCGKNAKTPLKAECDSITQSDGLKKKIVECSSIQLVTAAAANIDPLFLIPLSAGVKNCVKGVIAKKEAAISAMKISLLDDSITKAAGMIKVVDDSAASLKDFFDPSLYPEALAASAKMNLELAEKITAFKMKGITGPDLDAVKAQQKELAAPFRSNAKSKINTAFESTSTLLLGSSQMKKVLELMAKADPELHQSLTANWKAIIPSSSLAEAWKKSETDLPADAVQVIRSNNLKWMTYQYLIRQADSQNDDATKSGTLAIGATVYAQSGLDSKALESLNDSLSNRHLKAFVGPYLEAAYSSLNQKMTKRACEVLGNEKSDSITGLCAWVR